MQSLFSKRNIVIFAVAVFIFFAFIVGGFVVIFLQKKAPDLPSSVAPLVVDDSKPKKEVIGKSVENRDIEVYTFGVGKTHLLFVGGIHGGYEWNSVLLSYQLIDYLTANTEVIPKNLTIAIIPSVNPDGVYRVLGKDGRFAIADLPVKQLELGTGRLNARGVDLNRNFECKWKPKSTWRESIVSAGTEAFSEPEARAIRDFVLKYNPVGAIFWHSQANAVYSSECKAGILPKTLEMMNIYSEASGYGAVKSFSSYEVTGDAEGWLASISIPAITVELKTHENVEWEQNLSGIKALLKYFQ